MSLCLIQRIKSRYIDTLNMLLDMDILIHSSFLSVLILRMSAGLCLCMSDSEIAQSG